MILKIIKFFVVVVVAWLGVHIFAVVGIPATITYFIFWIVNPEKSFCLQCRNLSNGDYCSFCQRKINKAQSIRPHSLRSVILNTLLLGFLSILSLALLYGELLVLQKMPFSYGNKTAEFIIPTTQEYHVGEVFPFVIKLDSLTTSINAVKIDLGYDPNVLEVLDFSTQESFATVFIEKDINNQLGFARLSGGVPNPGYSEPEGIFATVYFKAKNPGLAKVQFLPSSLVLANDGKATNVIRKLVQAHFLIIPSSEANPEASTNTQTGSPIVLGTQTERSRDDQLILYTEPDVLGTSATSQGNTTEEESTSETTSIWEKVLDAIYKFDMALLNFIGVK